MAPPSHVGNHRYAARFELPPRAPQRPTTASTHKRRDGAVYGVASWVHIRTSSQHAWEAATRAGGRNTRGTRGGKRKDRESSPSGCPLLGHAVHSADLCYTTHPSLRPGSSDSKNRSAASEHKTDSTAAAEAKTKKKKKKKASATAGTDPRHSGSVLGRR